MVVFDHRERRCGIPRALERLGVAVRAADLGAVDYVLSDRLAIVRKAERDLAPWQALGRFHEAVVRAREQYPQLVLLVLGDAGGAAPPDVRRGAIARTVRRGISVLEASDPEDAAHRIARLADQEQRAGSDARDAEEIEAVAGFGRARAEAIAAVTAHPHGRPAGVRPPSA